MIEQLPLDIFDDKPAEPEPASAAPAVEAPPEPAAPDAPAERPAFMVSCQWCGAMLDNELKKCPSCGGAHYRLATPEDDTDELSCQWCLATIAPGLERCPECNARVVAPEQSMAGLHDPLPEWRPFETRVQQAQTQQLLVGMMTGGGLDSLVGGLIGLALTLLDD